MRPYRILIHAAALLWWLCAAPIEAGEPLAFADAAAHRRPHPWELDAEALLADAAGAAVGGGSFVLESPTGALRAGPRRPEGGESDADLTIEVELPLLTARRGRADLAAGMDGWRNTLQVAGRALALADLAAAFSRAWLAQAELELRAQDLAIAEAWAEAARSRVETGADAPYERLLVAGERDRALLDLIAARRAVETAWGELAGLAEVGPEVRRLDLASLPGDREVGTLAGAEPAASATLAALAGIEARRELATLVASARSTAASSRWAVAGDAGREGDEQVARLGVAYRFPLGGERAAIAGMQHAVEEAAAAEAAAAAADVRARLAAARTALGSPPTSLAAADYRDARRALDARIAEGKERPSEVLPLRRQLLEAALAGVGAQASRAEAAAELFLLEGGNAR